MTPEKKQAIEALLKQSSLSSKEIAKQAGISVSTLYAHFPGAKGNTVTRVKTTEG